MEWPALLEVNPVGLAETSDAFPAFWSMYKGVLALDLSIVKKRRASKTSHVRKEGRL